MTKKVEPSQEYLETLEVDLATARYAFGEAKNRLYSVTATAKLGQPEFETARKACLETSKAIEKLQSEIAKVRKALALNEMTQAAQDFSGGYH